MNITIEKLGKIEHTSIDINDLTILVGDNNSGKTYITYSIYGALKEWKDFIDYEVFRAISKELQEKGRVSIKEEDLLKLINSSITSEGKNFKSRFKHLFNDKEEIFEKSVLKLKFEIPNKIQHSKLKIHLGRAITFEGSIDEEGLKIVSTSIGETDLNFGLVLDIVGDIISGLVFKDIFYTPVIITAERLGISLFYKELDETRNSLVDGLQKLKQEDNQIDRFDILLSMSAYYATPIRDHISFTRNFDAIKKLNSELDTNYALSIIKEMLGAEFKKDNKQDIRFFTRKKKLNKFDIPLHLASSSARCIVDLYFYLKHLSKRQDLVIIDEPESHLTLRNQRLMAKLITAMLNIGIKVFITTHSDFLVKELNNLILLSNKFEGKDKWLKENKSKYNHKDFLNFEKVNVYQTNEGGTNKLEVSNTGIKIPFFDDEINDIFNVSNDLEYLIDLN
ncbi:hypothetical protein CGC48_02755 [Capnocytophaga cynodegmi]|uniref:Endonuclease GajA/Old nuclease/RecF-like AAA domain-containing protein n=1 Tax=Capnocytophaga cynodegmi TaxID=28189 RepID=A0A250E7C0_9FLAO|nr:AAA family ATPase [Capnocytophaga cynodegmi]ATA67648.1 hypothetical protein CGC48_02755 [Capnocytophaga cynodegmi]